MRRAVTTTILAALLTQPVAGCSQVPVAGRPGAAPVAFEAQGQVQPRSRRTDAAFLADRLRSSGWTEVAVLGYRVTARSAEGSIAVFDLTNTARTGLVVFTCEGTVLELPYGADPSLTDDVAAVLVAVAARMLLSGAQAFVDYWYRHQQDFDRKDCVIAVVTAMVTAATAFVPKVGPLLAQLLTPIVRKWIERWLGGSPIGTVGGVLLSARKQVPEVSQALGVALAEQTRLTRAQAGAR